MTEYIQYTLMEEALEEFHTPKQSKASTYYRKKYFHKVVAETEKALLIHFVCMSEAIWVPKKLCKYRDDNKKSIYVWKKTKNVVTHQTTSVITAWKKAGRQ